MADKTQSPSPVALLVLGGIVAAILAIFAKSVLTLVDRTQVESVAAGIARFASRFATRKDLPSLLAAIGEARFEGLNILIADATTREVYYNGVSGGESGTAAMSKRTPTPTEADLLEDVLRDEKQSGGSLHVVRRLGQCSSKLQQTVTVSVRSESLEDILICVTSC